MDLSPLTRKRQRVAAVDGASPPKAARGSLSLAAQRLEECSSRLVAANVILKAPIEAASDVQRLLRFGAALRGIGAPWATVFALMFFDHLLRDPLLSRAAWCLYRDGQSFHHIVDFVLQARPQNGSPSIFWSRHAGVQALNAAHMAQRSEVLALGVFLSRAVAAGSVDVFAARARLMEFPRIDKYLSMHMLSAMQCLAGFAFTGDVALAYSLMSPLVSMLYRVADFDACREAMVRLGVANARSMTYRSLALVYCEVPKVLHAFGVLPAGAQLANLPRRALVDALCGPAMQHALDMLRVADSVKPNDWSANTCKRHGESESVELYTSDFQLRAPDYPWFRLCHYCRGAETMARFAKENMKCVGWTPIALA